MLKSKLHLFLIDAFIVNVAEESQIRWVCVLNAQPHTFNSKFILLPPNVHLP
jgi:hypothetical protein